MSEKKTNLLLPLGIGAALLLLLTKKSKAAETADSPSEDSSTSPVPQITPDPAPEYSLPAAKSGGTQEDSEGAEPDDEEGGNEEGGQEDEDSDEASNTAYRPSSGGGGGSSTAYRPGATINPGGQPTGKQYPAPSVLDRKSLRFYSDQARQRLIAQNTGKRNSGGLRQYSDQARKFAERQKAARFNPLIIGNGKPRMGVQLPVTYRPGATSTGQQSIVITPNSAASAKPSVSPQPAGAIFPLKFGQRNSYIKEVQKKIGVSATGYFGTQTRAMLQKRFGTSEVSEVLYKQITTAKTVLPVKRTVARPVKKYRPVIARKKVARRIK
ncbi:MAG: hypothetical protein BGO70_16520 [Bacteroidetes bacterium 43-93]|nr:hypothetical protein [Bacteroidota bacterium]OJX01367.1 MAG: hypothetical protein BGO70_16520 [Bacteroidetes bacterium 43-93]